MSQTRGGGLAFICALKDLKTELKNKGLNISKGVLILRNDPSRALLVR